MCILLFLVNIVHSHFPLQLLVLILASKAIRNTVCIYNVKHLFHLYCFHNTIDLSYDVNYSKFYAYVYIYDEWLYEIKFLWRYQTQKLLRNIFYNGLPCFRLAPTDRTNPNNIMKILTFIFLSFTSGCWQNTNATGWFPNLFVFITGQTNHNSFGLIKSLEL